MRNWFQPSGTVHVNLPAMKERLSKIDNPLIVERNGGGGMVGAYQVGTNIGLRDICELGPPDEYHGSSVGGLNVSAFAHGHPADKYAKVWSNNIADNDKILLPNPESVLSQRGSHFRCARSPSELLDVLLSDQGKPILDVEHLVRVVIASKLNGDDDHPALDPELLLSGQVPPVIISTDEGCTDTPIYWSTASHRQDGTPIKGVEVLRSPEEVLEALCCTAAIPGVTPPGTIRRTKYTDGGIPDPYAMGIQSNNAIEIVTLASPLKKPRNPFKRTKNSIVRFLAWLKYNHLGRHYYRFEDRAHEEQGPELIRKVNAGEAIVFCPSDAATTFDNRQRTIDRSIRSGVQSVIQIGQQFMETLMTHPKLRKRIGSFNHKLATQWSEA